MNEIRIKNYRCFRDAQTTRLAPLTLLVGENSTGKTSFLALVRALLDIEKGRIPDFKASPYDLGSFREIAHRRGKRGNRRRDSRRGSAALTRRTARMVPKRDGGILTRGSAERGTAPFPVVRRVSNQGAWIEESWGANQSHKIRAGTARGEWNCSLMNPTKRFPELPMTTCIHSQRTW